VTCIISECPLQWLHGIEGVDELRSHRYASIDNPVHRLVIFVETIGRRARKFLPIRKYFWNLTKSAAAVPKDICWRPPALWESSMPLTVLHVRVAKSANWTTAAAIERAESGPIAISNRRVVNPDTICFPGKSCEDDEMPLSKQNCKEGWKSLHQEDPASTSNASQSLRTIWRPAEKSASSCSHPPIWKCCLAGDENLYCALPIVNS
jgi:hypothetical protein